MLRPLSLAAAVLVLLAAAAPGWSCSLVAGAPLPTNYELVRDARAIVLARSVSWAPYGDEEKDAFGGAVRFEVEEVLKGDVRLSALTLDGHLDFAGRGPEDDFSQARPGAYAGACSAYDYRLDHHYLIFLEWDDLNDRWVSGGPAFARLNEEVDVPDSPWVQAVRLYLKVAALRDYAREKAELHELRIRAAAGAAPKTFPKALVADIDRHFKTPTATKPPADLIDLYQHAGSDGARRDALWALADSHPPAARDLLRGLLLKETRDELRQPLLAYFSKVADHRVFRPLSRAWARLPLGSPGRRDLLLALTAAAGPRDAPRLAGLLATADGDQAVVLARWFASPGRDPRPALALLNGRPGGNPGGDRTFQDALAILGDATVVAGAEERMWSGPGVEDHRWEDAHVIAWSPLATADAAARKIIDSRDAQRTEWLVDGYNDDSARANPRRWDRLEDILRAQAGNAKFLSKLKTTFFYLRRDGDDEEKAMAGRLLERVREAIAALPASAVTVSRPR